MLVKKWISKKVFVKYIVFICFSLLSFLLFVSNNTNNVQEIRKQIMYLIQFEKQDYVFLNMGKHLSMLDLVKTLEISIGDENGCPKVVVIDITVLPPYFASSLSSTERNLQKSLLSICPQTLFFSSTMVSPNGELEGDYFSIVKFPNVIRGSVLASKKNNIKNLILWVENSCIAEKQVVLVSVAFLAATYLNSGRKEMERVQKQFNDKVNGSCFSMDNLQIFESYPKYYPISFIKPTKWEVGIPMGNVRVLILGSDHRTDTHKTPVGSLSGSSILLSGIDTMINSEFVELKSALYIGVFSFLFSIFICIFFYIKKEYKIISLSMLRLLFVFLPIYLVIFNITFLVDYVTFAIASIIVSLIYLK